MDQIIVVGAGVAGLAAACKLAESGLRAIILEARDRIGGRIHTFRDPAFPVPVELGAEFIHGRPPEIFELVRKEKLVLGVLDADNWCFEDGALKKCNDFWERWEEVSEAIVNARVKDCSFLDFISSHPEFDEETKKIALHFVEGFNAARADRISLEYLRLSILASEKISGDKPYRVIAGYDHIVRSLADACAADVEIRLNTPVNEIEWSRGHVSINGIEAERAIITLPLGVLQRNIVRFIPDIPEKRIAASRLIMGPVSKVILVLDPEFQEEHALTRVAFLHDFGHTPPTWWTTYPVASGIMVGWAGGPTAQNLSTDSALESLARALKVPRHALEAAIRGSMFADWEADPFTFGGYSHAPVGAAHAPRQLAAPVEETLFFAGEATNAEGHSGTVHGAIATGYRAASEVLAAIKRKAA